MDREKLIDLILEAVECFNPSPSMYPNIHREDIEKWLDDRDYKELAKC